MRIRMMRGLRILAVITGSILSSGCSGDLLAPLSRTADDPLIEAPRAVSLHTESCIDIAWNADPGADLYILQRSSDMPTPTYTTVYQGTGTSYKDSGLGHQSRFLYRLVKTRGSRSFGPSSPVLGISSTIIRDGSEPNDTRAEATELTYDRLANIYYFRSYDGLVVEDVDWYYVTIPPQYGAHIVVTQGGTTAGAASDLECYLDGGASPYLIISGNSFLIENSTYASGQFYFKIIPRGEDFVTDPTGGGGKLVDYTVSLYRIEKIAP